MAINYLHNGIKISKNIWMRMLWNQTKKFIIDYAVCVGLPKKKKKKNGIRAWCKILKKLKNENDT